MEKQKWIKIPTDFFYRPQCVIPREYGKYYELFYIKMILKSNQVENENYGYISLRIGQIVLEPYRIFFHDKPKFVKKALKVFEKYGYIQIQEERIKVFYPWESDYQRNSVNYSKWKRECLERDDYKCTKCGSEQDLCVHHIVPWRYCKDDDKLRYDIDNGITLCYQCHKKIHNGNWRS